MTQELNKRINLRGMLRFKQAEQPVPLEEVRLAALPALLCSASGRLSLSAVETGSLL